MLLAAGGFARSPLPRAPAPASTSAFPGRAGGIPGPARGSGVRAAQANPRGRGGGRRGGSGSRKLPGGRGRGGAGSVGLHWLSLPGSDIHALLAASPRAEALIPREIHSAPAGGTWCSCPLFPRATGLVSGVCSLGDPRSLHPAFKRSLSDPGQGALTPVLGWVVAGIWREI